jgi:hypothetical protein
VPSAYKVVSETSACDAFYYEGGTKDRADTLCARSENAIRVLHVCLMWKVESQNLQLCDKTRPAVMLGLV